MDTLLFGQFVETIPLKSLLSLLVCQSCLDVCGEPFFELWNGDLVVIHSFELFGQLNGLVE